MKQVEIMKNRVIIFFIIFCLNVIELKDRIKDYLRKNLLNNTEP